MKILTFPQALKFLYQHIPKKTQKKYPGSFGLERTKYLLELLDNPQEKIKIIHIAGTSGKGSTAYLTSLFLHSLGFKTGLHTSPHLMDVRERFQIDNQMINKKEFVKNLNSIIPAIDKVKASKYGSPTYFEILVSLAYNIFFQNKVNYAVIETGLGGLYDGTNVVKRDDKLSIITKIGFDHTSILGNSLREIAYQKAKIINKKSRAISISQKKEAHDEIKKVSKSADAYIYFVEEENNYANVHISANKTVFDFNFSDCVFNNIELSLIGKHQVENCSLALAAIYLLQQRDKFQIDEKKLRQAASRAYFPVRFEICKYKDKTIVIDGAHNPQKMQVFIDNLKTIFPKQKCLFLLALKKDKDALNILKQVIPIANKIILTSFFAKNQDWQHVSYKPEELMSICQQLNFQNYLIINDNQQALKTALNETNNIFVITGSFYLIGELYPMIK